MRRAALALALAAGLLTATANPAGAAIFTVDTTADAAAAPPINGLQCDSVGGGISCSLRAAIQEANASAGEDTVVLPRLGADYALTLGGSGEDAAATGDLDVTAPLRLQGGGRPVIDGMPSDRVLHLGPGASAPAVTVTGLEVRGGGGVSRGAGILADGGSLNVEFATIADSTAASGGGSAEGGGVLFDGGAHTVTGSTIAGNRADALTGAQAGGIGIEAATSVSILNSTVSSNTAESDSADALGGGIHSLGSVTLTHATMGGNDAVAGADAEGGNLYGAGGSVVLRATVISTGTGDSGAQNCESGGAGFVTQGFNLEAPVASGVQCGLSGSLNDRVASDAGLTALADRGGPTFTHALFSHSPALDAIPTCFPLSTDQRGEPRPGGVACEIGSFERQDPAGARCFGQTPTIRGRKGVSKIIGSPGADVILGSAGSERIEGGGGKDLICGGKGKDKVKGGPSRDRIVGEAGRDRLFGGGGKDELRGDAGRDFLEGGPGRDSLLGGGGRDSCRPSKPDKLRSCETAPR